MNSKTLIVLRNHISDPSCADTSAFWINVSLCELFVFSLVLQKSRPMSKNCKVQFLPRCDSLEKKKSSADGGG